ncbi:MAG: M48 family metallopeptidase [Candidatus Pacearchaeota archaeon]|nr:MAG: M48 family metallopeptidase [Candidatus Pacearchaeota archaeon]
MKKISFHDQIARNKRNSFFLVIIVFIVMIVLGYVISMAFSPDYFFFIMILAIIISLVYVLITYYNSDKIALASVKAKKADSVRHRSLYHAVENMSIASGMPMPKVYVMPGSQINAFATGRDPKHGVVCVTEGALNRLNKQELEAVVGHEMSHIANYDIRFITTIAIVVGAIAIFSQLFLRSLWFGSGRSRGRGQGNIIFFLIAIALAILAPIIVKLVQLAISRKREFMADAGSVKLTRYPPGMVNALKKIKADHEQLKVPDAVAPMFFSDTTKRRMANLFQTHPPIEKRISVLERM